MVKADVREWTSFRVGEPSTDPSWTNMDCLPMRTVKHVTHIASAFQLIADARIIAGLVFDQSRLNTERVLVTWLSPNDWTGAGGFRYGNVRFGFDWESIIEGKRFYWVESIAYGIPAARILVTDRDHSATLETYDPTAGDGPWWHDESSGVHYRNGKYCLEIMVEGDLELGGGCRIDFVDHHGRYCSIAPHECQDLGRRRNEAGGVFIAELIARRLDPLRLKWGDDLRDTVREVFRPIGRKLREVCEDLGFSGLVEGSTSQAAPIARAILASYVCGDDDELISLMRLFSSSDAVIESCRRLIADTFGLDGDDLEYTLTTFD